MITTLLTAALAAPYVAAADDTWHLRLDTAATWGIGGQMFLGATTQLVAQKALWSRGSTVGSLDVGLHLHYGNEATFLAPWIDRSTTRGAGHRVQATAVFGTTFHGGRNQRVTFGVHLLAGLNHWRSDYAVDDPDAGVEGEAVVSRTLPVLVAQIGLTGRLTDRVGLQVTAAAPLPTASSYAIGLGTIGLGPVFYLR